MSTAETRLSIAEARKVAAGLQEILAPACHRFEVAGSVRRGKPEVGDLEFVCLPKAGELIDPQGGLFVDPNAPRSNLLWEAIEENSDGHNRLRPIKPGSAIIENDLLWPTKRPMGSRLFKLCLPRRGDLKVELWMPASPAAWGTVFAIRTGSADFSAALVTRWTHVSNGGHSKGGQLHDRMGVPLSAPEEEDVFRLCRVEFLAPKDRIDGSSLRPTQ